MGLAAPVGIARSRGESSAGGRSGGGCPDRAWQPRIARDRARTMSRPTRRSTFRHARRATPPMLPVAAPQLCARHDTPRRPTDGPPHHRWSRRIHPHHSVRQLPRQTADLALVVAVHDPRGTGGRLPHIRAQLLGRCRGPIRSPVQGVEFDVRCAEDIRDALRQGRLARSGTAHHDDSPHGDLLSKRHPVRGAKPTQPCRHDPRLFRTTSTGVRCSSRPMSACMAANSHGRVCPTRAARCADPRELWTTSSDAHAHPQEQSRRAPRPLSC